jgi:hypothetical protein
MRHAHLMLLIVFLLRPAYLTAQTRSMAQDSSVNNLLHPAGTRTVPFGTLGHVQKVGGGPRPMLLIPGQEFGGGVCGEFMERQ